MDKKKANLVQRILSGLIIGTAMLIPGLSGGVLAVALGIYQPIVDAIAHPLTKGRESIGLLWPLGLGAAISLVGLSNLLSYLYTNYPMPLLYFFTGLVIGSLPTMVRTAQSKGFRLRYLSGLVIAFLIIYGLKNWLTIPQVDVELGLGTSLLVGFFLAVGTVIPGLSSSFLLIAVGAYQPLLRAMGALDFAVLIPAAVGFVPTAWLTSRLISVLFRRFFGETNFAILGILLATLFIAFPGMPADLFAFLLCGSLFVVGAVSVVKLTNISN